MTRVKKEKPQIKLPPFPQKRGGECVFINWKHTKFVWMCCDCKLIHRWEFDVEGDVLKLRAWRDDELTKQYRNHRKK